MAKSLNKLIFGVVVKETELSELPAELTAEYQLTHLIGKGSTETIHFVHQEGSQRMPHPLPLFLRWIRPKNSSALMQP